MPWMAGHAIMRRFRCNGRTVLLLPSKDCGWSDLGLALKAVPGIDIELIDGSDMCEHMSTLVAELRPDIIIASTRVNGESTVPMLCDLQQSVSPTSRIALVTPRFTTKELARTEDRGIVAHLQWSDLHPHTLPHLLEALIFDDITIVSREVADAFVRTRCCPSWRDSTRISLTVRERSVLRMLAEGHTEQEIAQVHGTSSRTVERQVSKVKTKLGARTQFELAVKAIRLGVVS